MTTSRERKSKRLIDLYEKWGPIVQEHADNDAGCSGGNTFFNFHDRILRDVIETFPKNKTQIESMIFVAMEYMLENLEENDYPWSDNFREEWAEFKRSLYCYWS
jgi:hypothetical protein